MKIAVIIERTDISLGGAERSVQELTDALKSNHQEVHVIAAQGKKLPNYHILCSDKSQKRTSLPHFTKRLKQHLTENHYDIIHSVLPLSFAHIYQPRGGTYPETTRQSIASYPCTLTRCYKKCFTFANLRRNKLWKLEKQLCQNPNGPIISALSNYVAQQFKKYYHLPEKRIRVIHNGVKISNQPVPQNITKLKDQLKNAGADPDSTNNVLFLFAANNFRLKGLRNLLKATAKIPTQSNSVTPKVIITGKDKIKPYFKLARKLNIRKNTIFLGSVHDITDILSLADVAVLPTFYDPASRFILEAIAFEKPVITTSFNGATDLFNPLKHGQIIENPNNTEALANAMKFYMSPENRKKSQQAILDDNIKKRISIDRVAKDLITLYHKIV